MKRSAFLWEIGCEELPARWLSGLRRQLEKKVRSELEALGFPETELVVDGTLRRLVVHVAKLDEAQADRVEQITGPPLKIARDADGAWTPAAIGFARKNGVSADSLAIVETDKGAYLALEKKTKGRKTIDLLPELMARVLRGLPFPKFMHWDASLEDGKPFPFGRPIRWMVALYGAQVVPFVIDVVGSKSVKSGRHSRGHRFLAPKGSRPGARFSVTSYAELKRELKKHYVILDTSERRKRLEKALAKLETKAGSERVLGLEADLVAELVEWPGAVLGTYPEEFLNLPEEVRHTVLVHHQHYFPLAQLPAFIAPTNMGTDPKGNMRKGAERVVVARLRDALFFWDDDMKKPLSDREPELEGVLFHAKLGSYREKKKRVVPLAATIAVRTGSRESLVRRAASLLKNDLVTGMVGEFPELQGIMGGLYARAQGEPESVWKAVYSHYDPVGLDDERFPLNREGAVVSIADKLDTLASMFSVGIVPTGSRDPFGLRRQALGILRVLLESESRLSFSIDITPEELLGMALPPGEALDKLADFMAERLRFVFSRRYRYDEVNAVFALGALDRPVSDVGRRLEALAALRGSGDFEALSVAFKRVGNILSDQEPGEVAPADFVEAEERELYDALEAVAPEADAFLAAGRYESALRSLSTLRPHVDRFFDEVLVMAEDASVRRNRLALLERLRSSFGRVADLSEIVPAGDA